MPKIARGSKPIQTLIQTHLFTWFRSMASSMQVLNLCESSFVSLQICHANTYNNTHHDWLVLLGSSEH